jgi:hypothetical protein
VGGCDVHDQLIPSVVDLFSRDAQLKSCCRNSCVQLKSFGDYVDLDSPPTMRVSSKGKCTDRVLNFEVLA